MLQIIGGALGILVALLCLMVALAGAFVWVGAKMAGVPNAGFGRCILIALASTVTTGVCSTVFSILPIIGTFLGARRSDLDDRGFEVMRGDSARRTAACAFAWLAISSLAAGGNPYDPPSAEAGSSLLAFRSLRTEPPTPSTSERDTVSGTTILRNKMGVQSMGNESKGSVGAGIFWMVALSLLLFWLPIIGPLLAGIVGGKKSGGVGAALAAVFLPGVVFGVVLFALASALSGMPLLGAIAGMGGLALSLVHIGPLLVGAIIGGLFA